MNPPERKMPPTLDRPPEPAKERILQRILQRGHFVLTSGLHSPTYLQVALLLQDPVETARVCVMLAERFRQLDVSAVVGPALGAVIPAYEVARALGVRALWTERVDGRMTLRRSFALQPGERILVVEDVVTTGGSVREVIAAVEDVGGRAVGIGAIVDRTDPRPDFGVPFSALIAMKIETYTPDGCPLCHRGVPQAKPGSRTVNR